MLLPEVTPGNTVVFGISFPESASSEITIGKTKTLSNCPSTEQDSYLKQAFCSCKSLLTESAAAPAELAKTNLPANESTPVTKPAVKAGTNSGFFAQLLHFSFSENRNN